MVTDNSSQETIVANIVEMTMNNMKTIFFHILYSITIPMIVSSEAVVMGNNGLKP